jgi:putative tricarboxylic transport membrane protein
MHSDMLSMALHALMLLLEPARLGVLLIGVMIGLGIGVLPGLSGIVGMALLIPFTYTMDAASSFALLLGMAAVITSSDFIIAILFGVPGHVGAAATVIDGHAMARRGEAGRAFGAGFAASLMGGLIGALVLFLSIPVLRPILLAVGSPELLAFTIFGMSMVATLAGRAPLKGLTAAALGTMLALIGDKAPGGTLRWTFGTEYLYEGLPLIPFTLGIFAIPELAELAVRRESIARGEASDISLASQWEGVRDAWRNWRLVVRCALLGTGLGAIPGIGSAVIDWIAYGYAQRSEKNADSFGTGDVRGVIAPEASNNAKEGGHLVPTLAFGVPAGASMALLLGALLMHGLTPGPEMLTKHLDVTYAIVWSLTLAHVIGAAICLLGSRWLARVAQVPPEILLPVVLSLVMVAAYQGSHDWGDLATLIGFGALGWAMKQLNWPRPPLVLGFVVGETFERYLFISTQLYGWHWVFRPAVVVILMGVVWSLYAPMRRIVLDVAFQLRNARRRRPALGLGALFTPALLALIVAATAIALQWPRPARLVALTACGFALLAGSLNWVNELFGAPDRRKPHEEVREIAHDVAPEPAMAPRLVRQRATLFFAWLGVFTFLIALVGFLPAIAVFVFANMTLAYGKRLSTAALSGLGVCLFCWLVFHELLQVIWPESLLGDAMPALRAATGFL